MPVSLKDAASFLREVRFALRYGATPSLPLPSLYQWAGDQRRALEVTNQLLESGEGIETNLIAGRLVIAHREVVPALYALRIRFRARRLSDDAARALSLICGGQGVNAGDVRRMLGVEGSQRPDRADVALGELMTELLVDRGPASVPATGIPYLSKEGYPYRAFEEAHRDLVAKARHLTIPKAIAVVVKPLAGVPPRKVASMLKLLAHKDELPR